MVHHLIKRVFNRNKTTTKKVILKTKNDAGKEVDKIKELIDNFTIPQFYFVLRI
jgi:hypothetical protein